MSAGIGASRERVWCALTDPDELVRWDESRIAIVDRPDTYPEPGQHVRWRYKLGGVPSLLHERPTDVDFRERLAADFKVGTHHYQQLYVLVEEPETSAQPARTRVSLKQASENTVQLIGAEVDRFELRRMLIARVDATLRALQKWCENA